MGGSGHGDFDRFNFDRLVGFFCCVVNLSSSSFCYSVGKGLYLSNSISITISSTIKGDEMNCHEFGRWMRHTAAVPKGYLKRYILMLLSEKPMSGAEIMEEIQRRSGGLWKPSPGSVYPLLAWLQDNGYIKESQKILGNGSKRYTLTDKGKQILEELKETDRGLLCRKHPPFWLLSPLIQTTSSAISRIIGEAYSLLGELTSLGEEYADVLADVEEVLSRAVSEIKDILERAKEKKRGGGESAGEPFKWTPPYPSC